MSHLCKDKDKAEHDELKAKERKADGKTYYKCKKCKRISHKAEHLCDPKEA
ncbi:MAG TPA: hypothetical protein VGL77_12980 [Armatimonadota bacterium]